MKELKKEEINNLYFYDFDFRIKLSNFDKVIFLDSGVVDIVKDGESLEIDASKIEFELVKEEVKILKKEIMKKIYFGNTEINLIKKNKKSTSKFRKISFEYIKHYQQTQVN